MALDPTRLLLLLTIRDQGSITRAAELTGRTPPAVSQQLARLEHEVGSRLVQRHPHGAELTALGSQLAAHAERIAGALHQADEEIARHYGEHDNRLRLGAFPTAGLALLPEALAALRHRHPRAELSVIDLGPVEGITLVEAKELDIGLVGEYTEELAAPDGVRLIPLVHDPILAVLPSDHPLADTPADQPLRLVDFAHDPWACAPPELPNRRQLDRIARAAGFHPRTPFESESYAVAQAVVSAGVAVAFIPRLALSDTPGTVHRPLAEPQLFRRVHAAVSSADQAPLTPVFLRLLHSVCSGLDEPTRPPA